MVESGGKVRNIDLNTITLIEFNLPRRVWDAEKLESGPLPPPWAHSLVGELPHGGEADVKGGRIVVSSSSPPKDSDFDAFSMAYRPLPDGDAQITAFIARMDTYEEDTKCGLMMRDGTGVDARNVFLSASHREPAQMRNWKRRGGSTVVDQRHDIRPGSWLRLVRESGKVTGYVSKDAAYWRELSSVEDEFEGQVYACLVSQGKKPRRRWSATFEHVDVTTMDVMGPVRLIRPKFTLSDGNRFHSEIESATPSLFRLGGTDKGRVIPVASVASIEFYRPIPFDRRHHLGGDRAGALLADGDFIESKFGGIKDGVLTTNSALIGKREFDIDGEVDALVIRPAKEAPPTAHPIRLDTWAGGQLNGKALSVDGDALVLDTVRLRARRFSLQEIHRITRRP